MQHQLASVSLVIPFLNEEEVLPELFRALARAVGAEPQRGWELVLIDDGSTDRSADVIREHAATFPGQVRVIHLSRNFGHQAAVMAGIRAASGDATVIMDADLQDPPALLPDLLQRFEAGFDVVYAIRKRRKGAMWKRAAYWLFYRVFSRFAEIHIPLDAGDFGLMSRRVCKLITAMPEREVLIRGLRAWVGFRQVGFEYDRPERMAGEPKYELRRLLRLAKSALFGYSTLPLRFATLIGLLSAGCGMLYGIYVLAAKLFSQQAPAGWTSIAMLVVFLGGVQMVTVGILGEYIGRIHQQVLGRPLYVVDTEWTSDVSGKSSPT